MVELPPLPGEVLPAGMRSRFVSDVNGLRMHVLEAGWQEPRRPALFLLHGFPEIAYSWRKIIISGRSDWGIYQRPGTLERMQTVACTRMVGCHLLEGAGHWVQQEQPARVSELLADFLKRRAA